MKELPFLTHDLGARNDPKLVETEMDMRGQGKAIWWDLVEMLWENDGYLPLNFKKLAYSLRYATEEEVERLVMNYGLFEHDGEKFWNRSALERITHKKNVIEAKRDGGRKGARSKWLGSPTGIANDNASDIPNGIADGSPSTINKLINEQINKDNNNNIPPTADDFFEIFFFRNLSNPAKEAERFVEHYRDRGWTFQDGTPVTDFEKAAGDWKPEGKAGKRFNSDALNWYRAVWNAARTRVKDARKIFLESLQLLSFQDQKLVMRYKTKEDAEVVSKFIIDNDLYGDWQIDFRFSN